MSRPDGSLAWVRVSSVPTLHEREVTGVVVTFADVTERYQAQRRLRRYEVLFRHANDLITVVDQAGRVRYGSPSVARILGYPDDHRPDGGIFSLVHPDDREAAALELQALLEGTRPERTFVVRVFDALGHVRHLECVGVDLLDEPDVQGVVITARDVSERERLSEQLAHQARHDPLTDLANRTWFAEQFERALHRAERSGVPVAVGYVDLDDFKAVNDELGHAAGDGLLRAVADALRRSLRAGDLAARIGGDEFLVLLDPVRDEREAVAVGERVLAEVCRPCDLAEGPVAVSATMGMAMSGPGDAVEAVIKRADRALYRAKAAGGAQVSMAPLS